MRVLHLIHSLNRGGIESWLISMLRQIPRQVCEMDVCCKGFGTGDMAADARVLGATVLRCPLGPAHIGFARQFLQILEQGQYDILHNHVETYSGFPVWLAHQKGIPVITSFHNTNVLTAQVWLTRLPGLQQLRSLYSGISVDYALRHSDRVTGCSQGVLTSIDPQGNKIGCPSEVLYYGVRMPDPPTLEEKVAFRQQFGWPAETPLILHVGRIIEQKNHAGLLAIFHQVVREIPTAKLLMVGAGPLQRQVEAEIDHRGLNQSVRLLGLREDVPTLMGLCDLFLLPSLHEGLPVVTLEASAAQLPIVASRIPGVTEALLEGETALLHPVEEIAGMAASVVRLLRDRPLSQQLATAGRLRVQQKFSAEASARSLLAIYQSLLASHPQPALLPKLEGFS